MRHSNKKRDNVAKSRPGSNTDTVKPLYSEQSRDPNFFFTIQRCSPKRGEICSCTHDIVPAIQCTHIKTVPSIC